MQNAIFFFCATQNIIETPTFSNEMKCKLSLTQYLSQKKDLERLDVFKTSHTHIFAIHCIWNPLPFFSPFIVHSHATFRNSIRFDLNGLPVLSSCAYILHFFFPFLCISQYQCSFQRLFHSLKWW